MPHVRQRWPAGPGVWDAPALLFNDEVGIGRGLVGERCVSLFPNLGYVYQCLFDRCGLLNAIAFS